MARTTDEIQEEILEAVAADATLSALNSGSGFSVYRLWARVVAAAHVLLEQFFDAHSAEVAALVANMRPHTLRWYQQMAVKFQYGRDLPDGDIFYDNTGVDVTTIEAEQIIAQAAAVNENGTLVLKVAREVSGDLEPLTSPQYDAFEAYMGEVKDAGVSLSVRNFDADKLHLTVDVYYDPLVLSSAGARIDGTSTEPVQDAAKAFLRSLPFNGLFVKAHLVDALQAVDGVYVPEVRLCEAARNDSSNFTTVDVQYQPYSGFLRFFDPSDLAMNFISQEDV